MYKRLTETDFKGEWTLKDRQGEELPLYYMNYRDVQAVKTAIRRLAEYENTGLAPEEVRRIIEARAEALVNIGQARELVTEAWRDLQTTREMLSDGMTEQEFRKMREFDENTRRMLKGIPPRRKLGEISPTVTITPVIDITMPPGTPWNTEKLAKHIADEVRKGLDGLGPGEEVLKKAIRRGKEAAGETEDCK